MLVREDREELLICGTNGALERLNHAFPNAHPSMSEFVGTIRRISADKYTQYDRVAYADKCTQWMNFSANSCYFWIICLHLKKDSVLTIDIILPNTSMNYYTTALTSFINKKKDLFYFRAFYFKEEKG